MQNASGLRLLGPLLMTTTQEDLVLEEPQFTATPARWTLTRLTTRGPSSSTTESPPMTEAHLVTFNGSPRHAHSLVECLEREGVRVAWTPPAETRGAAGEVIGSVVISIATKGPAASVTAAVRRFQTDYPGQGHVQVDWQPFGVA
jgi:hypothetical protein